MSVSRRLAYGFLLLTVGNIIAVAGTFIYVGHAIHENNKRTCGLYQLIYQPTPNSPVPNPRDPAQKRGSEIRKEIGKLIKTYDCEER